MTVKMGDQCSLCDHRYDRHDIPDGRCHIVGCSCGTFVRTLDTQDLILGELQKMNATLERFEDKLARLPGE